MTPLEKIFRFKEQHGYNDVEFRQLTGLANGHWEWMTGKHRRRRKVNSIIPRSPAEAAAGRELQPEAALRICAGLGWSVDWLVFDDRAGEPVARGEQGRVLTDAEERILDAARELGLDLAYRRILGRPGSFDVTGPAEPTPRLDDPPAPPSARRGRKGG
jgi:hypothetical protein